MTSRSVWQSPAALIRTTTSVGLTRPPPMFSIFSGVRGACSTAARISKLMTALPSRHCEEPKATRQSRWKCAPGPRLLRCARNDEKSHRPFALDRDPVHDPALAVIIVDRVVLDAAIVPERDRDLFPAEATGELGPHRVL